MTETRVAMLADRGVVSVTGADAAKLLQGLITNDVELARDGVAIHAGLLSPQGKILFAFFVVPVEGGYLLETEHDQAAALAKRLTFYKLRASVTVEDVSADYRVSVAWGDHANRMAASSLAGGDAAGTEAACAYADPRDPALGMRLLTPTATALVATATAADYHAHRIALGIPDAVLDYPLGDTFPHEAAWDRFHGVDFAKGCFVGQEVVARMQHKTIVRKRVVPVAAETALPAGNPDVTIGAECVVIGRLGSVSANRGLALLRLDRAAEAIEKGMVVNAGGVRLAVAPEAISAYRAALAAKPAATP